MRRYRRSVKIPISESSCYAPRSRRPAKSLASRCGQRSPESSTISTGRTPRMFSPPSPPPILADSAGARHDVREPATVTLREAMAAAADQDDIARQYVTGYEDIFAIGLPALEAARRRGLEARWSTLAVYLAFLAASPDTHVMRKFGAATAEAVRREGADWSNEFAAARDPSMMTKRLLTWDSALKTRGINPGTSADLTVATLFASRLSQMFG